MTTELTFLTLTAVLTGLLWIPAVAGQIAGRGFLRPEDYVTLPTSPLPGWATRANRAHLNAMENFGTFAAVVVVAHLVDVHTAVTAWAATVYFFARLLHAVVMISGFKYAMARTVIFGVAWAAFLAIPFELARLAWVAP